MSDLRFHLFSKYRIKLFKPKMYPLVNLNNKVFLPVHINKNAGTSLLKAFGKDKLHLTIEELRQLLGSRLFDKAIKVAIVRNPYDRVVSQYYHRVKTNQNNLYKDPIGLNNWVEKVYQMPYDYNYRTSQQKMFFTQSEWLMDDQNRIMVDHLLSFEHLDEDFRNFCQLYNIELNLPWVNKNKIMREELSIESLSIINEFFKDDFENFKYPMRIIK